MTEAFAQMTPQDARGWFAPSGYLSHRQLGAALERREYEWAHMAFTIWPKHVREACRRGRSIAIAHGLGALFEPASSSPGRRTRSQQG
jgi:hypothetical protein